MYLTYDVFIEFDDSGVCNICNNYENTNLKILWNSHDKVERFDTMIIGFSGGRDSSYGVLLIDQMFDKNVVAASYDWGMVTDLARRNQARVCTRKE